MKALEVSEILGDLREDWLNDADTFRTKLPDTPHRRSIRTAIALAACLCLLLTGATALAVSGHGTKLIAFFTDRREAGSDLSESGYDLHISVESFPLSAFSEDIREAGSAVAQQYLDRPPYASVLPGRLEETFPTRAEACSYIGLAQLKDPAFAPTAGETTVSILGSAAGEIESLHLESCGRDGNIRLQFFTDIHTEHQKDHCMMLHRSTEHVQWRESFYTTQSGKSCHIIDGSPLESGYAGTDAYLTVDGILYTLHLAYLPEDAQRAQELLRCWAECF